MIVSRLTSKQVFRTVGFKACLMGMLCLISGTTNAGSLDSFIGAGTTDTLILDPGVNFSMQRDSPAQVSLILSSDKIAYFNNDLNSGSKKTYSGGRFALVFSVNNPADAAMAQACLAIIQGRPKVGAAAINIVGRVRTESRVVNMPRMMMQSPRPGILPSDSDGSQSLRIVMDRISSCL